MKYLFVFFLLPLFLIYSYISYIFVFLLCNNICYTYLRIYSRLLSNSNFISFSPRCTPSFIHSRFSFTPSVLLIFPLFSSSLFPPPYSYLLHTSYPSFRHVFPLFLLCTILLVNSYILVFFPPNLRSYHASLIFSRSTCHKFLFPFFVPFSENQQAVFFSSPPFQENS